MERQNIYDAITNIYNTCELNYVKEEAAIRPELAGLKLFEEPIMKFGSVDDELFEKYKEPGVIGHFMHMVQHIRFKKLLLINQMTF